MKTTDPRDPLDRKIDELLASQLVKAPDDFVARTLAAAEAEPQQQVPKTRPLAPIIRFALPAAAAVALAFVLVSQFNLGTSEGATEMATNKPNQTELTATTKTADELTETEIDELLMLQEGLSGFAGLDTDDLSSDGLLNTLDALYSI